MLKAGKKEDGPKVSSPKEKGKGEDLTVLHRKTDNEQADQAKARMHNVSWKKTNSAEGGVSRNRMEDRVP